MSMLPGSIVPVPVVVIYSQQVGVGVAVGVSVGVAVGVGVGDTHGTSGAVSCWPELTGGACAVVSVATGIFGAELGVGNG
jgi:hypothetical protein